MPTRLMKRIEFNQRRRNLHEEILSAIIALMKGKKCKRIVFNPTDGKMPQVLRWLSAVDLYENVSVRVLKFDGKGLSYKATQSPTDIEAEKRWWSLRRNIAETHIISLYHAVYDHLQGYDNAA